jgi:hypothetical protein
MKATLAVQRMFFWGVACSLPALVRPEWLEQWKSEIWYVHSEGATRIDTWRFTLGSLNDAVVTRREFPEESSYLVHSPGTCLLTMALLNVAMISFGLLLPLSRDILSAAFRARPLLDIAHSGRGASPLHDQTVLIGFTFVAALIITSIRLGPQLLQRSDKNRSAMRGIGSAFLFFLAKLLLGILLVYFATLTLSSLGTQELSLLQVDALLAGYIILLRWAYKDQKLRCPTCLKRLGNPVRLGRPSWILLDWNMQEYICPDGHGVMQVPAAPLMGQSTQEWIAMT